MYSFLRNRQAQRVTQLSTAGDKYRLYLKLCSPVGALGPGGTGEAEVRGLPGDKPGLYSKYKTSLNYIG